MERRRQAEPIQTRRRSILVVEDERDARHIYSEYLAHNGYRILAAASGEEALALAKTHRPQLALVDIILPGMSGHQVARRLRARYPEMKIIFITALDRLELAVEAMRRGAFDYLTKAVSLPRLLRVVERAWKAYQAHTSLQVGDLTIDLHSGQATLEGRLLPLTPRECEVLVCLAQRKGRKASYKELWRKVWGCSGPPDRDLIRRTVSNLRSKIGKRKIACVWGRGYRLG